MATQVPERAKRVVGFHEARTLAGQHMVDNLERLEDMNPALGRSILENGFGGMTPNAGFGYRDWALQTLGVLTAIGDCADQLDVYLEAAFKHGATEDEVLAIINHAASFVGSPRAVNTMRRCRARIEASREFDVPPPKETVIHLADHDTLVLDTGGSGTPIILIHALSMDSRMFQKLIPRLAKTARVIAYDLRGHGLARGAPLTQSLDHLVSDLHLLFDKLGIAQADVYGASFGGAVAQYFTLAHPRRVRALVPMATSAQGHPTLHSRATRAENGEMATLLTEAIIRWFAPETIANNPWCVRYARAKVEHVRVEEWAAAWKAMAKLDCLHRIREIECPILVLAGTKDLSATPERMRPIYEQAKDGEYVELPTGTHMMAMEMPEQVAEALLAFRKKVDSKYQKC
jgi:3-oxoadipate enol-lactonase